MKKVFTSQETVFLILYAVYAIASTIDASLIDFSVGIQVVRYLEFLGLIVLFCKIYLQKRSEILWAIIFAVAFGIVAYTANQTQLLLVAGLLICSKVTTFRRIVQVSLFSTTISLVVVVGSSLIGVIPDYTYERWNGVVHSFGFSYYSEIPFILLFAMMEYMYLRKKKLSILELAVLTAASYVVFHLFMLRLAFVLTILCIVLYIIVVKYKIMNLRSKCMGFFAKLGFPVCAIVSFALAYFYNKDNVLLSTLDNLLSTRLYNGHLAFERYDVTLFGQWIEMVGNTEMNYMNGKEYFYIDCGYLFSLISYGCVFTVLLICLYTFILDKSRFSDNAMLFVWGIIIMLFSMINNTWITVRYNPYIFALPLVLEPQIRQRWREYKQKKYVVYRTFE